MSKINETNYPRRTQASYEDTDMLVIQKAGGNTYTTRIEDLREDCQETLAPALNTMRENLATVEGSTASKAYAKGDFLVFGGRLCKAKTSIASGATLVLDTNIELDSVGDELSSLNSDLTVKYKSTSAIPNTIAITQNKCGQYIDNVVSDIPSITGYKCIAGWIVSLGHPGKYNATLQLDIGISKFAVAIFAATNDAYTIPANDIKVQLIYVPSDWDVSAST